jgi:16S rRNA (guanine966-N2)-methyltransferase
MITQRGRPGRSESSAQRGGSHQLRIIGGRWRGRRLSFPAIDAIRPSPDRVRETVFNWLQPVIAQARVLDLFAGSGALGLEALSRGAAFGVFVDREVRIAAYLKEILSQLQCEQASVHSRDALEFLRGAAPEKPFNVVFLDPPFRSGLLAPLCALLTKGRWLAPQSHIYLECEQELVPLLPAGWQLLRSKRAGQVGYHLARADAAGADP